MVKRTIAPLLCSCLLSACETPGGKSALECGLLGAVVTAAICKAVDGNNATCAASALGVGAVGAYACYSYTDHVAQRRKALAGQENNLDAQLKYVRDLNSDTEKMNATTHSQLAKVEARVDHLRTQVEKGRLNAQQRSQEHEKLAQQVSAAQIQVDAGKQALQELRTSRARDSRKSAELDAEIRRLESLLAQAQQNTDAMSAQVKAFDALPSA